MGMRRSTVCRTGYTWQKALYECLIVLQDLLKSNAGVWMQNLESFPGPFGGVDGHTTEVLLEYLEKMATRLDDGDAQCCTLESAAAFPESAATACRFLCCLVRANGDVQSSEFWQHFSPVLARRAQAMRRDRETSDLRKFCVTSSEADPSCSNQRLTGWLQYGLVVAYFGSVSASGSGCLRWSSSEVCGSGKTWQVRGSDCDATGHGGSFCASIAAPVRMFGQRILRCTAGSECTVI
eukprot:g31363.t1